MRTQNRKIIAFSACILKYFIYKDLLHKVVGDIYHGCFHKILFAMIVLLSHDCFKKSLHSFGWLEAFRWKFEGGGQIIESAYARGVCQSVRGEKGVKF